jgi:chromosome segregation ATPase
LLAKIAQEVEARQIQDWHEQIDYLTAELQQEELLLEKPDFLADSDKTLLKIEQSSLLESLQLIELTNRDLTQKITQINSRLQAQQLARLMDQLDQLETSRAGMQVSLTTAEEQITQFQAEIRKINQDRVDLQAEIDQLTLQAQQVKAENGRLAAEVNDLMEVKDDMERVIAETHEITFRHSKTERLLEKQHQRHTSYIVIILIVAFFATLTGTLAMTLFIPSYAAVISGLVLLGIIIYALWLYFTDLKTTE